jgi:hypothetical protein
MNNAQKAALANARRAVLAMSDEPQELVTGTIRQLVDGFEIRLSSEARVFLVRTSAAGEVELVTEEQVH